MELQRMEMQIWKMFGAGKVKRLSELPEQSENAIRTGYKSLDEALGIGGIPEGRIVEIYGDAQTGKSSLALQIAKQAQKKGAVLYIDADCGLCSHQIGYSGIKKKNFYVARPETMEEAFELCKTAASGFSLIVIDSIAALPVEAEATGEMGDYTYELQSKRMAKFLRIILGRLSDSGCTLLLVNQLREDPTIVFGNPVKTPCGRALKHYASVRIEASNAGRSKNGASFKYIVRKNKCAEPMKWAQVNVVF